MPQPNVKVWLPVYPKDDHELAEHVFDRFAQGLYKPHDDDEYKAFGHELRSTRQEAHLGVVLLAALATSADPDIHVVVNPRTLLEIELGYESLQGLPMLTQSQFAAICKVLGVTPDEWTHQPRLLQDQD